MFQTDSIPVIPEAQTGAVPYMEVNESEMSLTYTMDPEDIVYGLGENVRGINKRGWIYESKCSDESKHLEDRRSLYAAHNFIVVDGREKFGLFIDYPGILTFDVGYTELSTLKITASDWNLDVYVIEEDTVTDIIRSFRRLIGRSYIAPLWAFGNGQSRWGYINAEDVREVVRKHRCGKWSENTAKTGSRWIWSIWTSTTWSASKTSRSTKSVSPTSRIS